MISGKSGEVDWPVRVDMAYIDGDHSFEGCADDIGRAISKGAKCVVVHDIAAWWGPREWLDWFRSRHGEMWDVLQVGFDNGLAIAMKREPLPEVEFSRSAYPAGRI